MRAVRSESESQATGNESIYRSVAALAADIGLSERSTRNALRRGEIPHIRVGRRFILPKTAIAEWLRTAGRTIEVEKDQGACGGEHQGLLPGMAMERYVS
jgi:excisionase family DNA binding protein